MGAKTVINLVLICWAVFITGVSLTLITPFYPTEALAKGVSVTQTGVVLSTVFIATIVFTPIFGKERTSFLNWLKVEINQNQTVSCSS